MSHIGEREDAPELDLDIDGEEHGAVPADTDAGDSDAVGEEPDERAEPDGEEDAAGADEGQAGQPDQVAPRPRSAATIAVQEAKRAAKEARAEAEATRRELEQLRQAAQGRQTEEQKRLEAERIALMPPEERLEHLLNRQAEQTRREVGALQFQMQDGGDRIAFQSLAARNDAVGRAYASVADEVETKLKEMRASGGNAPRETIAKYLIGERAVERALKGGSQKQKNRGREAVQRESVRPAQGRGDQPAQRQRGGGDEKSQRAARLGDQLI